MGKISAASDSHPSPSVVAAQDVAPPMTAGQSPTPDGPPQFLAKRKLKLLSKGEFKYLVWYNVIVALTVTVLLIGFLG